MVLDDHQKEVLRKSLVDSARNLLGIPYKYGAEWTDLTKPPTELDCSELTENVFLMNGLRMPDGSQAQFEYTVPTGDPKPGDLGFFGRGGKTNQIYHVGMLFDYHVIDANRSIGNMIEARGHDPKASFETGKVILRPTSAWTNYGNWVGFRSQPKLL